MTVQRDRVFEMLTFRTVECYAKSGQPFDSWADEPLKRPGPYKSVIVSQRSQRGSRSLVLFAKLALPLSKPLQNKLHM